MLQLSASLRIEAAVDVEAFMIGEMLGPSSNHNPNLSMRRELTCIGSERNIDPLNEYNEARMLKTNHIICAVVTFCCFASFSLLFAQTPQKPAFEVATVKPIPSMISLFDFLEKPLKKIPFNVFPWHD